MHREHRVEQVSEPDAVRFGYQTKERPVAVEAPWAARLDNFKTWLVVAIDDLVRHAAVRSPI